MQGGWIRYLLGTFLVATILALTIRLFVLEDYRVDSDSMSPNLLMGDYVLVTKFDYALRFPFSTFELLHFRSPRRGEIVAFTLPEEGFATYIKRVVALGGDTIQMKSTVLFINGVAAKYEGTKDNALLEKFEDGDSYPIKWPRSSDRDYGPVVVPHVA